MASKSGATTLECTYCSKQYTEGEGEKTVFGNYKCKVKRSRGQEQYHSGKWAWAWSSEYSYYTCCKNTVKSSPGCKTRPTTVQVNGPHKPTPASLARAQQIAAVGAAEHARREAAAKAAREQQEAAAHAERKRRESQKRKAAARLELQAELKELRQQHQTALASERANSQQQQQQHAAAQQTLKQQHQTALASERANSQQQQQQQQHAAAQQTLKQQHQTVLASERANSQQQQQQHLAALAALKQQHQTALSAATSLHAQQVSASEAAAAARTPAAAINALHRARQARAPPAAVTALDRPGVASRIADPALADAVAALRESQTTAAFQVPTSLEDALAAADGAQAQLDDCNAAIFDACARAGVDGADDPDLLANVRTRDAARTAYADAAAVFQLAFSSDAAAATATRASDVATHFGMLNAALVDRQHVVPDVPATGTPPSPAAVASDATAAVEAWYNDAAATQSVAVEHTESAAAALSSELAALAAGAARLAPPSDGGNGAMQPPTQVHAPQDAVVQAPLDAACSAVNHAVQSEAKTYTMTTDPAAFPSGAVAAAVQWFRGAATEAACRFETIYAATVHHAAASAGVAPWLDPTAKEVLVASVSDARKAKKRARKHVKTAAYNVEMAAAADSGSSDSPDSDDAEVETGSPEMLASALRAAKAELARATKHCLQVQSKLSGVICDHFPELSIHEAATKDPLLALLGDLGGVPAYDSLEHYNLGDRLKTTGTHEMLLATHINGSSSGDDDADHLSGGGTVVLKSFALDDPKSRKTFEKELRIMARLRHPNVVRLAGVAIVMTSKRATAYLEMPFMQLGDLRKYFAGDLSRRADAEVQQLLADVLKALEYLHRNGVVHLDVKPDNILIAADGAAKLSDFDVSKDAAARTVAVGTAVATTMAVTGLTLGYAAPEVLEAAKHQRRDHGGGSGGGASSTASRHTVGPGADLWSAGCVLFFMSFYPSEITMEMGSEPMNHVPATCTNTNLRNLLGSVFAAAPSNRPTAAQVLASPYLKVHSQRELAARTAKISAEERAMQVRCDAAFAMQAATLQKQQQVVKQQHELHQQLAAAEEAQQQAAEDSVELCRLKADALQEHRVRAAELRKQVDKARRDQEAAAAARATLDREQAKLLHLKCLAVAPAYWNARELTDTAPTQRVDVTAAMQGPIKLLMNNTAKPQFHSKGRDSHGLPFTTFEPVKVYRIENHQQWRAYVLRRDAVRANVGGSPNPITPPPATAGFAPPSGALLDAKSNEHLLFHGTKPAAVSTLCNRGFDERVGRLGGLFGAGCYFAENSSKSDEYVPAGAKQHMFLCRVVLGTPFVTPRSHDNLRRPPCVQGHFDAWPPCGHDRNDSLLATTQATDPSSFLVKFREFVVYDHSQCYPEYLIEYERR